MTDFFKGIPTIKYEGPESQNDFAFRHYNPDEVVLGKTLKEHLRFAIAYWHSFAWRVVIPLAGVRLSARGLDLRWNWPRSRPMQRLRCLIS